MSKSELRLRERWDAAVYAASYVDYGPHAFEADKRYDAANYYAPSRGTLLRTAARFAVGLGLTGESREQAKRSRADAVVTGISRFLDRAQSSIAVSTAFAPHHWVGPSILRKW